MAEDLDGFARRARCVFYNDLSHMNPAYNVPEAAEGIYKENEILYHKKNIYLLCLQFEHVILCTDNLLTFTKHIQADVISAVVSSDWFRRLLEGGVIVLSGWGARRSMDMMQNQIDYAGKYKPQLKQPAYVSYLKSLSRSSNILVREYSDGEEDHIKYLLPKVDALEDVLAIREFSRLRELVLTTQSNVGYVGTIEIFPEVERIIGGKKNKEVLFYRSYYQSWQEYSSYHYAPALTVDTARVGFPGRLVIFPSTDGSTEALSALYSPDFFCRYLEARFGKPVLQKLLGLEADALIRVRNGDWKVFLGEYHKCILAAAQIPWIRESSVASTFLLDEALTEQAVNQILGEMLEKNVDSETFAAILSGIIGMMVSSGPMAPLAKLLRKRINRILHLTKASFSHGPMATEHFLEKLRRALEGKATIPLAR